MVQHYDDDVIALVGVDIETVANGTYRFDFLSLDLHSGSVLTAQHDFDRSIAVAEPLSAVTFDVGPSIGVAFVVAAPVAASADTELEPLTYFDGSADSESVSCFDDFADTERVNYSVDTVPVNYSNGFGPDN